jgi:hypothetical protein
MTLNPITLKIQDLPQELLIDMPEGAGESEIERLKESVRSQVAYNSRFEEDEKEVLASQIHVTVVEHKGAIVKIRLES